jgi:hypothetical protein
MLLRKQDHEGDETVTDHRKYNILLQLRFTQPTFDNSKNSRDKINNMRKTEN